MPTLRPAAARRYSWAFDFETWRARCTSSVVTHADMPSGAGRAGFGCVTTPFSLAAWAAFAAALSSSLAACIVAESADSFGTLPSVTIRTLGPHGVAAYTGTSKGAASA